MADHDQSNSPSAKPKPATPETEFSLLDASELEAVFLDSNPKTDPDAGGSTEVSLPPSEVLAARYILHSELAHGGMGIILRGRDPAIGRELAIKIIKPEITGHPELVRRFLDEARICGQLQHPAIVPLYELGRLDDGRPYFTMKLIKGRNLAELLEQRCAPTEGLPRWLSVFEQIAQAVGYAHSRKVIHRDLKPANVIVGSFGEVQVMDWGLAKVLKSPSAPETETEILNEVVTQIESPREETDWQTRVGSLLGTVHYMPPEQANGRIADIDARSDVFGLGGILCHILTGEAVYLGEDAKQQDQEADLAGAFARLDACTADPELIALAKCCLSPRKTDRPADGALVAEAVAAYQAEVQQRLHQERIQRERQQARSRWQLALAVVLVSILGAGAWWLVEDYRATDRLYAAVDAKFAQLERELAENPPWDKPSAFEALQAQLSPDGPADLRRRLNAYERLWQKVVQLNEIHKLGLLWTEHGFARQRQVQAYHSAFRQLGLDIEATPLSQLAQRIEASPIRNHLLAALDDWAGAMDRAEVRSGSEMVAGPAAFVQGRRLRDRLLAVAYRVEPETELRNPVVWADPTRRARQIEQTDPATLSPSLTILIGVSLQDPKAARRWFEKVALKHPDWYELSAALAALAYFSQQWEQAAGYWQTALALRKDNYAMWVNLGLALANQGKHDAAIEAYQTALRLNRNLSLAYDNLAFTYSKLGLALAAKGEFTPAVAAHRKAIGFQPNNATAHNNLGTTLHAKGELNAAIEAYRTATRLNPGYAKAYANLGVTLAASGEREQAINTLRTALKLQPNDAVIHSNLGNVRYDQGDLQGAIGSQRTAIKLQPDLAMAHYNLGRALLGRGMRYTAIEALRTAIRLRPNDAKAHYNLGVALVASGQLEQAIRAYRTAIELKPDDAEAYTNLGVVLARIGRLDSAIEAWEKATQLQPRDALAHNNLGSALATLGRLDAAVQAFRTAIRHAPDYAEAHCGLGYCLLQQAQFAEALVAFRQGDRLGSARPDWRYPSAALVRKAEALVTLDARWRCIRSGQAKPQGACGCLRLAELCQRYHHEDAAAVALYREAFRRQPNLIRGNRYRAAQAALRVAVRRPEEAFVGPDPRSWHRELALHWLRGELASVEAALSNHDSETLSQLGRALDRWRNDPELASVRAPYPLAGLPHSQRQPWIDLWSNVYILSQAIQRQAARNATE